MNPFFSIYKKQKKLIIHMCFLIATISFFQGCKNSSGGKNESAKTTPANREISSITSQNSNQETGQAITNVGAKNNSDPAILPSLQGSLQNLQTSFQTGQKIPPQQQMTVVAPPGAPTINTAIAADSQVTLSFTPHAEGKGIDGTHITTYIVTSNPGKKMTAGVSSPITISGLSNGTAYTFTVKAINPCCAGPDSTVSSSLTPTGLASPPIIGTAQPGVSQATITFAAPSSNGGAAITSYIATSNPGNKTGTGSTSPIIVSGLTNDTAYTFTIQAINSVGASLASAASNKVTPALPATCSFNGASIPIGSSTTAYSKATVASPATCASVSESRTCTSKDNLSGTFAFSSCMVPSKTRPTCAKNTTYCIHNSVNNLTYSQNTNLKSVLSSYTKDQGYCAAASTSMIFSIMQQEGIATTSSIITNFPATIIDQAIFYAGNKVGTNWVAGGTPFSNPFEKVFHPLAATYAKTLSATSMDRPLTTTEVTTPFLASMPVQNFMVLYGKDAAGVYAGGHALMVKGFENDQIIIWDPWNRIYNVTIVAGVPKVQSTKTYGMIESYASQNIEVRSVQSIGLK